MDELQEINTGVTDDEFWNIVLETIRKNKKYEGDVQEIIKARSKGRRS